MSAQCNAVTTAAALKACLEGGNSVTLAATIDLTGFTITIPDDANLAVNMGAFNITWTGTPWVLANPAVNTVLTFTGSNGSIAVVKNSPRPGEITVSGFNTAGNASSTLPVELYQMTTYIQKSSAESSKPAVVLAFATASERDNAWFVIERSADGRVFSAIGKIAGAGTSTELKQYEFIDRQPLKGVSYYRLKQVDFNGQFSYSAIQSVRVARLNDVLLSPSPTHDQLQVQLEEDALSKDAAWQVLDMAGRIVLTGNLMPESVSTRIDVSVLPTGNFVVRLTDAQHSITKQFFKE